MKQHKVVKGHMAALGTAFLWGTTFISTKILLKNFIPVEILFIRFFIGYIALLLVSPRPLKSKGWKQEIYFIGAGLCGVTLYFLFENIALTYTLASNVGVIVSIAPIFTAILAHVFLKEEKIRKQFLAGFVVAMVGIFLISFNGSMVLKLNPLGDILAILAAGVWSVYSILSRKIGEFGYSTVQSTRKIFRYGLLFTIPAILAFDCTWNVNKLADPIVLCNILFLGLGASAACYVTWNFAIRVLGAVRTSVYIYLVPVITIVTSAIILRERITLMAAAGTALTLAGLFLSERKAKGE